jgi:hypothetical protein
MMGGFSVLTLTHVDREVAENLGWIRPGHDEGAWSEQDPQGVHIVLKGPVIHRLGLKKDSIIVLGVTRG